MLLTASHDVQLPQSFLICLLLALVPIARLLRLAITRPLLMKQHQIVRGRQDPDEGLYPARGCVARRRLGRPTALLLLGTGRDSKKRIPVTMLGGHTACCRSCLIEGYFEEHSNDVVLPNRYGRFVDRCIVFMRR